MSYTKCVLKSKFRKSTESDGKFTVRFLVSFLAEQTFNVVNIPPNKTITIDVIEYIEHSGPNVVLRRHTSISDDIKKLHHFRKHLGEWC